MTSKLPQSYALTTQILNKHPVSTNTNAPNAIIDTEIEQLIEDKTIKIIDTAYELQRKKQKAGPKIIDTPAEVAEEIAENNFKMP